jgi:flagellar hook-associated protein 3 FlgL
MRTDGLTTLNLFSAMRRANAELRSDLANAQNELSTGRKHDLGLALGSNVARNISWRNDIESLGQQIDIGKIAAAKADLAQSGLEQLKSIADALVDTLAGARTAQNGQHVAKDAAESAYGAIAQVLQSTFSGENIFSGINLSSKALKAFHGASAEEALNSAFSAQFGFLPADPEAVNLTPLQMKTFAATTFAQEFEIPSWNENWSGAASNNVKVNFGPETQLDVSANANANGIRTLVKAVALVMHSAQGQMNSGSFNAVAEEAMKLAAAGVNAIGGEQARIGILQQELQQSIGRAQKKSDLLKEQVQQSEGVDAYEAAMRVNLLMTQMEQSFAVTARISRMSLVNYI